MQASLPPTLASRFEVLASLGAGSFGRVYRVRDRVDGQSYALKVIDVSGHGEREQRELLASVRVVHPRVIRCFHAGIEGGAAYLVLEEARGSFEDLLASGADMERCWNHLLEASEGVEAIHRAGLVHRDLKPANLLMTDEGAKIADLGLAKGGDLQTLTATGVLVGTPGYLAPEQARGGKVGPQADLFALGVMFYQVVEGRLPYPPDSPQGLLGRVARGMIDPLERGRDFLEPRVQELLAEALHPEPEGRRSSVGEWARELGPFTLWDPGEGEVQLSASGEIEVGPPRASPSLVPPSQEPSLESSQVGTLRAPREAAPAPEAGALLGPGATQRSSPALDRRGLVAGIPRPGGAKGGAESLPVPAGPASRTRLLLASAAGVGGLLLLFLVSLWWVAPREVLWTSVGDRVVVSYRSPWPGQVQVETPEGPVATRLELGDRGARRLLDPLPPGREASLRLTWPGGASPFRSLVPDFPAVRRTPRPARGRAVRLDVIRPCRLRWRGESRWVEVGDEVHSFPAPIGPGPWVLEWQEQGVDFSQELTSAVLLESALEHLQGVVGSIEVREETGRFLGPRYLELLGKDPAPEDWGEELFAMEREHWQGLQDWIPELLTSAAPVPRRRQLLRLWNDWSLYFGVYRDLVGVPPTVSVPRGRAGSFGPPADSLLPPEAAVPELFDEEGAVLRERPLGLRTEAQSSFLNLYRSMQGRQVGGRVRLRFSWPREIPGEGPLVTIRARTLSRSFSWFRLRARGEGWFAPVLRPAFLGIYRVQTSRKVFSKLSVQTKRLSGPLRELALHATLPEDLCPAPGTPMEVDLLPLDPTWPADARLQAIEIMRHPTTPP